MTKITDEKLAEFVALCEKAAVHPGENEVVLHALQCFWRKRAELLREVSVMIDDEKFYERTTSMASCYDQCADELETPPGKLLAQHLDENCSSCDGRRGPDADTD